MTPQEFLSKGIPEKIYINLGCGGNRPQEAPWVNIDQLLNNPLSEDGPEWKQLLSEQNYIECDLRTEWPFAENSLDGILMSHFLEHLDAQEAWALLVKCHKSLKPNGVIRISVPNPVTFSELTMREINGETIDWGEPNPYDGIHHPKKSFLQYALMFEGHKQILGFSAIHCLLLATSQTWEFIRECTPDFSHKDGLATIDNRKVFSLIVEAQKG
jgi:predicted SAM-dependent methyltransferase